MSGAGCAIVVGHGPGVGEATARAFAAAGHPVALIARNGEKARLAAQALATPSAPARTFDGDAGEEASLAAALVAANEAMGPPAVLVYNAAHWRPGPVLALGANDFEADYRTCVIGALVAAKWAVPLMQARGGGSILFTGGGLALHPSPDAPTLSIGKGAIRALALMLAEELVPAGIRVGTVTIAGQVGSPTLPASRVAAAFLELHRGAPDRSTAEVIVRP